MFLFLNKKPEDAPEPSADQPAPPSEFIPYYGHWDAHTLLTKNGELVQIVKISGTAQGADYENIGNASGPAVRDAIRNAIGSAVDSDAFALWLHTVRKRRRIHYEAQFKEPFAARTHALWQKENDWKYQYYNEIYISIIHEGQTAALLDQESIKHVFPNKRNRQYRNAFLEKAAADLDRTAAALMETLSGHYDARRLSVVERTESGQPVFYSEPMEFLSLLVNLRVQPFPLDEADLSQLLATATLTFGFNALEAKMNGKRRFAALLTVKQYTEIPPDTADRVLQAPMEFIVSQAFNFIPSAKALEPYKEQKELFELSGDTACIAACNIDDVMSSDKGRPVDFGQHQISIMVLADDYKQLDAKIAGIKDGFGDFGLIPIREDIKLEEAFWAQLPGNFEFIRRKSTINTARIAGLCRLNRFAAGAATGNHWGPAAAIVPTIVKSPYFFNFHQGDNGHTALLDFNSFRDQAAHITLNFLLIEARKFDGRICVFDRNQSARLLWENLGGKYHVLPTPPAERHASQVAALKSNAFTLEDNPRNRSFLLAWCASLMAPAIPTDAQKETLRAAIDALYAGAPENRHLPALIQHLSPLDPALAKSVNAWYGNGKYAYFFEGAADDCDMSAPLTAFDMTPVAQRPETVIPLFSYLMHRLIASLDGRPTIVVVHEALDLTENAFFAPRLESMLEMLRQNNAMMIFTISNPLARTGMRSFNTIMQNCRTHIYVPDDVPVDYTEQNIGLSKGDARMMRHMKRQKGEFLVKQNNESVGLSVDLSGLDALRSILANDSKDLTATAGKK